MAILIDTNIAIALRDGREIPFGAEIIGVEELAMSVLTMVELEAGIAAASVDKEGRRARTDMLLEAVPVLPFEFEEALAYGIIISNIGFSRTKTIDYLIAATALTHDMPLLTTNIADFQGIPGLNLIRE